MVCKRTTRMSTGGKALHHPLALRGAHCSTPPLTITLRVPCTSAAPGGDPNNSSDGNSNSGHGSDRDNNSNGNSNNSGNNSNGGPERPRGPAPQPGPGAPPSRPLRPTHTYRSSRQLGEPTVIHFQSMLTRLRFDALPAYYSKVVYRADG
jgi:hypothetical protein